MISDNMIPKTPREEWKKYPWATIFCYVHFEKQDAIMAEGYIQIGKQYVHLYYPRARIVSSYPIAQTVISWSSKTTRSKSK